MERCSTGWLSSRRAVRVMLRTALIARPYSFRSPAMILAASASGASAAAYRAVGLGQGHFEIADHRAEERPVIVHLPQALEVAGVPGQEFPQRGAGAQPPGKQAAVLHPRKDPRDSTQAFDAGGGGPARRPGTPRGPRADLQQRQLLDRSYPLEEGKERRVLVDHSPVDRRRAIGQLLHDGVVVVGRRLQVVS